VLVKIVKVVLVMVAVTATALAIAQDQETVELRSALGAQDPGAADYLSALVAADLVSGNAYDVLVNGNSAFPAMLQAIAGARERISLETYIYEDGLVADQFTSALENAAQRGVTVNLIFDAIGASNMDRAHFDRLEKAGCHLVSFNPSHWYTLEELNYRTHRKILVVDGEVAFTGGIGIADQWSIQAPDGMPWRDTHVQMRGPIVRLLEAAFYENFIEGDATVTPVLAEAVSVSDTDDQSMIVRSSPSDGASDLKRLYLLAIAMARQSIEITSPYFVTDESTTWAFKDAIDRGVTIRILVESGNTDAPAVKYASRAAYEDLLEQGVQIYEYTPAMMHAKTFVVDGVLSIFGSANFDNRSLELNDEVNVAVVSPRLAARFLHDFANDLQASRRLTLDEWRQRPFMEKVHEHFWSYFGEVF
jgi:cardiolipin synthase